MCFFFKQKTAYELRISDWSSDVCSSDLPDRGHLSSPSLPLDVVACDWRCRRGIGRAGRCTCPGAGLCEHSGAARWLADHAGRDRPAGGQGDRLADRAGFRHLWRRTGAPPDIGRRCWKRSEEDTAELQSLMSTSYAVLCLKKKHK